MDEDGSQATVRGSRFQQVEPEVCQVLGDVNRKSSGHVMVAWEITIYILCLVNKSGNVEKS